ncbi:ATP-binding cassette domain-containing protein [Clostridium estertheticum]|uniref:ATP-binding cassette domain-containing protein n=1 Tax=Clostridium estertheticum TaxID=238834 RepID=A0A7Y3WU42_9CLOT|nr:ATP-binding cassette domain-containing protein [Clostridium estertheticum]MBW9172646.1 ATP-binding cassette domain-containing protein [Clostridium estertheticum]NNU77761.1 ATP-binding cassette domain-containing protein [Clostridium estertheticum]WBL45536.1 ATP-binding cassette domain-containing protein [Clostridium estertheticum]WLC73611.1 ATP-binding cassette domain-containing protein [Clostridium estertheticum]
MLEVKNLTKKFKSFTAVNGVSFVVNGGEILGLIGENGAGKTTIMRMLATMLKVTAGEGKIAGHDLVKEPESIRGEIGILFGGEVGLYDRLTARENIMYFAQLNGMSEGDAKKSIEELIRELEMSEFIDKRVGKFSRGMKQKVAIARSIVHKPSVMLFDEPSTGLDVSATRLIQDFIFKCKSEGKAIVFSSHSMTEIEKLCDRVVIIHKGKVVEHGTISALKAKYKNEDMEEVFVNLIGGNHE